MKVVVVGGGSTYTPELIDGFARLRDVLPVDDVVLVDPDETRLRLVGGVSQRIVAEHGAPHRVQTSTDLEAAVEGADVVLIQLRVGGQAARAADERMPLDLGCIGQETTGPGGLAKALRTVPVVLDVASVVARKAPQAWIVNFTNPVGIVTRALTQHGYRAVGLCNVAIGMQHFFAGLLGTDPAAVHLDHAGLNHLTWERQVLVGGTDVLPELIGKHAAELGERVKLPAGILEHLGVVPSYYLRYYYCHDDVLAEQRSGPSRAEDVAQIEEELLDLYADPEVKQKPRLLEERGGALYSEAAVQLMAALRGSAPGRHVVNMINGSAFSFLPPDAVIEASADVADGRLQWSPIEPVDAEIRGLIGDVYAYEELALEAAQHGGRDRVVAALVAHPLVRQWHLANELADRIITGNRQHLTWAA